MSILQNKEEELRYIRKQNLTEESKVIGNYYRDIIRSFGVDCHYFKLKLPAPEIFKTVIDQNTLLLNAYGYDDHPDWSISSNMITYMEVENDVLNLDKFGAMPTTDVTFYFDSTDFAVSLAPKLGQIKEYKIKERKIEKIFDIDDDGDVDLKLVEDFETEIVDGKVLFDFDDIANFELDKEYTLVGHPRCCGKPKLVFPSNEYLYKCFNYKLEFEKCEDILVFLTFKIKQLKEYGEDYGFAVVGKMHGGILFRDLNLIGKYTEKIMPQVGDIVTIDFPDEANREQYEITDCTNKQLTTDGINPLLHTYIWKCKAKRFVKCADGFPEQNLADNQVAEAMDLNTASNQIVSEHISVYDNNEDAVYGGYGKTTDFKDINGLNRNNVKRYEDIDDGTLIDILEFGNKSRLVTNGYDLYFVNETDKVTAIKMTHFKDEDDKTVVLKTPFDIQFIKATADTLVFVNIENSVFQILAESDFPPLELDQSKNIMTKLTIYGNNSENPNKDGDNFFKFSNCGTLLMSYDNTLYCKFENSKQLIKIAQ